LLDSEACHRDSYCSVHEVWHEAQDKMIRVLTKYNITELVRREKENLKNSN